MRAQILSVVRLSRWEWVERRIFWRFTSAIAIECGHWELSKVYCLPPLIKAQLLLRSSVSLPINSIVYGLELTIIYLQH